MISLGRLLDVSGYALHLSCCGNGQPTVIHDAGLGDCLSRATAIGDSDDSADDRELPKEQV